MSTLKNLIPSELILIERSRQELRLEKEVIVRATAENRALVIKAKKNLIKAILSFFGVCIFSAVFSSLYFIVVSFVGIIFLAFWIQFFIRQYTSTQKTLAEQMNQLLLGVFSRVLGFSVEITAEIANTRELFKASGLSSESFDTFVSDDVYSFGTPYKTLVREVMTTREEGSGKSSKTVTVFQGTFVEITLLKTLEGKTYISTEGDKIGMAHQSFWGKVLGSNAVAETTLEWNEFEKDLHVATDNGAEARYILTPNFMVDLHEWWQQKKENIRLVFKENKLFILLPDTHIKLGESTDETNDEALLEYVLSVVRPLWRIGTLVEDIKL